MRNLSNNILYKVYSLPNQVSLTTQVLTGYIDLFWNDVFKDLSSNNPGDVHLLLLVKVEFADTTVGYRTLADLRKVNYNDKELFTIFLTERLGKLSDSYRVEPITKITFSYIVREGVADDTRLLLNEAVYQVTTHSFNNMVLPLSMNPSDYGEIFASTEIETPEGVKTRYAVDNNNTFYYIETVNGSNVNNVKITGQADIKWTDTKIDEKTFKREIGKNTLYIKDGVVVVKEKILPAKPFKTVKPESKLASIEKFMTIDIETLKKYNELIPFLICGYYNENGEQKAFHSICKDLTKDSQNYMMNSFISQLLQIDKVKYVYAHNLSGFDGVFLLRHLINYKGSKVEPILFNDKLMAINFTYTEILNDKKNVKKLIFKDSFLLLPQSLRKLCVAFSVEQPKSYFPFELNHEYLNYVGDFPSRYLYKNISDAKYEELLDKHLKTGEYWDFNFEAKLYCLVDCHSLFEILVKFNELVHSQFKINIHKSLTLPSLAMKIYKAHYLPKNTVYQLLGQVEKDIRESYTGGAVDDSS